MKKSPAEEMQGQSVEDIFREGLEGVEPTPPPRVWENIDRILDNQELHHYRQQVKWYRSIAAAALLLLLSVSVLLWQNNQGGMEAQTAPMAASGPATPAAKHLEGGQEQEMGKTLSKSPLPVSGRFLEKEAQNEGVMFPVVKEEGRNSLAIKSSFSRGKAAGNKNFVKRFGAALRSEQAESITITAANRSNNGLKGSAEGMVAPEMAGIVSETAGGADSLSVLQAKTILLQKQGAGTGMALAQPVEQEEDKATGVINRWILAVAYSPQYAYSPVKVASSNSPARSGFAQPEMASQYQEAVAEYNNTYTPTYSYSTLVGAAYSINDKWQVESGLMYTQNEATSHHSYLVTGNSGTQMSYMAGSIAFSKNVPLVANALNSDVASAAVSVNRTNGYTTKYKYQQLGVPLRVSYKYKIKKVFAYVAGGVNLNLLVQNSIVPETDQVEAVRFSFNDDDSPFRVWQWATTTSVGVGYEVTRHMSLIVAPEVSFSLTPMLREEQRQTNPYQLGVSIGGRWRLAK